VAYFLKANALKTKTVPALCFFVSLSLNFHKMRFYLKIVLLLVSLPVFSQEKQIESPFVKVDSLYREDQFYFGVTYNRLQKTPAGMSQNGLSTTIHLGFLRDMPINKSRTFAIAAGFGFAYNKYHQNLVVSEIDGTMNYEVVPAGSYATNKLEAVFMEFPLEIRWRNSTPESHQFWRIYSGFKLSCLLYSKTKYDGLGQIYTVINNPDFNKLQYGPYLAMGWNTWNLQLYYGLNSIFKSGEINQQRIEMKTFNMGLMFYIL
jgi:hypothetical protein